MYSSYVYRAMYDSISFSKTRKKVVRHVVVVVVVDVVNVGGCFGRLRLTINLDLLPAIK